MSNLPDVIGALITEKLGEAGVPGSSIAMTALKGYFQRRSEAGREILLDELRSGEIDAAKVAAEDDCVAVIYRYLRASWEGTARINLRLLAKAIVGRLRTNTLVADEFMLHADALASLSRDEIILLATLHRCFACASAQTFFDKWAATERELSGKLGWEKPRITAIASRAQRSGYVVPETGLGPMVSELSYGPSPYFLDLCKTVDFDDALRREARAGDPLL